MNKQKPHLSDIDTLANYIAGGNKLYKSLPFGGAGVCIVNAQPQINPDSFYPDPRYVVTQYARELSWVFEELYRFFLADKLIDSCSKFEFFGRLANAANAAIEENKNIAVDALALKVIDEARIMLQEIKENRFEYLLVTSGNRIAADN